VEVSVTLPPQIQQEITAYSDRDLHRSFHEACVGYERARRRLSFNDALYAQAFIDFVLDERNRRHPQ
jgi:hypothetical protein